MYGRPESPGSNSVLRYSISSAVNSLALPSSSTRTYSNPGSSLLRGRVWKKTHATYAKIIKTTAQTMNARIFSKNMPDPHINDSRLTPRITRRHEPLLDGDIPHVGGRVHAFVVRRPRHSNRETHLL